MKNKEHIGWLWIPIFLIGALWIKSVGDALHYFVMLFLVWQIAKWISKKADSIAEEHEKDIQALINYRAEDEEEN